MNKYKILLIDDDQTLLELLSDHFRNASWNVETATSGAAGLDLAVQQLPDLIILDVMMPGMDGWQVCQHLREYTDTPIIMLTAKDQELDKLRGFRLGVDDYVTKPFSFAELTARAGAVLARVKTHKAIEQIFTSGDFTMNLERRRVTIKGESIDLTPTEYKLLEILVRHAGRTVPAEKLLQDVWGSAYGNETEHVKHYIWSLRKKLETDPGNPRYILTERGFGYRFD
jgi:two-component system KDP operon response regulator KdpE